MPDLMLRFTPDEIMVAAFLLMGLPLAGIAMALRALAFPGPVRWIGLAGLAGLALLYGGFFLQLSPWRPDEDAALFAVVVSAVTIAWLATAFMARRALWLDIAALAMPAIAAAVLIWLDQG